MGIIGRNGAGKSTLLKILSRITKPTRGQAQIYGRVGSLLEVGTGFHPELTGRENIFLNGAILGMKRKEIERKFDEIVDFAEIEKFLDTPVKRYSSGMYVRLAFAVAAHLEPEILLVDEVLAVGDAEFQKKCLGKMGDVAKRGRTVLFVSHNMAAVKQLCKNGILLVNGQITCIDNMTTVVDEYILTTQNLNNKNLIDLTNYKNPFGANELVVLSVELLNSINQGFMISWDEPLRLRIRIKVLQKVSSVSFAFGVTTIENLSLFTVRSMDTLGETKVLEPGEYYINSEIRHNLRAGIYILILGIASGNYNYYYNPSVSTFEVSDIGSQPYLYKNYGVLNCDLKWEVSSQGQVYD